EVRGGLERTDHVVEGDPAECRRRRAECVVPRDLGRALAVVATVEDEGRDVEPGAQAQGGRERRGPRGPPEHVVLERSGAGSGDVLRGVDHAVGELETLLDVLAQLAVEPGRYAVEG